MYKTDESYLLSITMNTYIRIFYLKKKHQRIMNREDIVGNITCITTQLFFYSFTFNRMSVPRFCDIDKENKKQMMSDDVCYN